MLNTSPFSFVVAANNPFNQSRLENYLRVAKPPSLTVVNNQPYAKYLKTNVTPTTMVYCRNYDIDGDENDWTQYSPADYMNKYEHQSEGGLLGLQVWNEPGFGAAQVDKAYEIAKIAVAHRVPISLFGASVGTPPDTPAGWARYDQFVSFICAYKGLIAYDDYEYFAYLPTSGMITPKAVNGLFFTTELDTPAKWPHNHRDFTNMYHAGRIRHLFDYCAIKGYSAPTVDIGEAGNDDVSDNELVSGFLKSLPATGRSNVRGWRSAQKAWEQKYPGIPFQKTYMGMLDWLWSYVMKPIGVRSMRLFMYGDSGGWSDFNYDLDPTMMGLLTDYASALTYVPTDPPATKPPSAPTYPPRVLEIAALMRNLAEELNAIVKG